MGNRRLKHLFRAAFFVLILSAPASADETGVATYAQYKRGSPVTLRLSYRGGVDGWDGAASIENKQLILANAMFISITDGENQAVEPIKDKVLNVWADTLFRDPFELEIDLSWFYEISRPGRYKVHWGCKDVRTTVVLIEIID